VDLPEMRLASTFKGHSAKVVTVAFSPDGTLVGTGSSDGLAKVWDVQRCRIVACSLGIRARCGHWRSALTAGCSRPLAETPSQTLDLPTQRAIQTWTATNGLARAVAFSGDGSRLVVVLGETAMVWDVNQARELRRVSGCERQLRSGGPQSRWPPPRDGLLGASG